MRAAASWQSQHFASSGTRWSSHLSVIGAVFLQLRLSHNNFLAVLMQLQTLQSPVSLSLAFFPQSFSAPSQV
jgi:hypothetical protein